MPLRQWGSLVGIQDSAIMEKLSFEEFRRTELEPLYAELDRSKAEQSGQSKRIIGKFDALIEQNKRAMTEEVAKARYQMTMKVQEIEHEFSSSNRELRCQKETELQRLSTEYRNTRQRIYDLIEMKRTRFLQEGGES